MLAQHITPGIVDELSAAARASPRRRQHLNLHASPIDPCQRLLNAIEPDSYVRPHCHSGLSSNEMLVVVKGKLGLVLFDNDGSVSAIHTMGEGGSISVAELPPDVWHTVIALTSGTVLLEAKAGPYNPAVAKTFAPWAPENGAAEAGAYVERLRQLICEAHPGFLGREER